ncbi:hypothetical protein ABIC32_002403 [Brevundimonas sp. 1080]
MPVGFALATRIQSMAEHNLAYPNDADSTIVSALHQSPTGYDGPARQALSRIATSVTSRDSIDDFVNEWAAMPRLAEIAKLCIAQVIIAAESATFLGPHSRGETTPAVLLASMRPTWLDQVVRYVGSPRFERRRLHDALATTSFVVFNYDRCIEYYLYANLTSVQGLSAADAAVAISRINIIHVYGAIDPMPELGGRTSFGAVDARGLTFAASGLQTYCESITSHVAERIRATVQHAERLVFLGCAFHPQNMAALFPAGVPSASILGTSWGMRAGRLTSVTRELMNADDFGANRVDLQSMTAASLIDYFHDDLFS